MQPERILFVAYLPGGVVPTRHPQRLLGTGGRRGSQEGSVSFVAKIMIMIPIRSKRGCRGLIAQGWGRDVKVGSTVRRNECESNVLLLKGSR